MPDDSEEVFPVTSAQAQQIARAFNTEEEQRDTPDRMRCLALNSDSLPASERGALVKLAESCER